MKNGFIMNMRKIAATVLALILVCGMTACSSEENTTEVWKDTLNACAGILLETVTEPNVNSVGGEWTVLGLARWSGDVPENWFEGYYERVEEYVKSCEGVLHHKKYTEYSRVILALTAIGKDPSNVAGYDLTLPLADYEQTIWQGNNGAIWALIALDSNQWEIPANESAATQAARSLYVQTILDAQQEDGGWSLSGAGNGTPSDADMTCMSLQALAKYQEQPEVAEATDAALRWLSEQQKSFSSAETNAQLLVALCELGISPEDERFVKDGKNVVDELLTYYREGEGFCHTKDDQKADLMATEQAFYALVAYERMVLGISSLYDMAQ